MNKYNNGKIYKIVDNTNGNVYYGSTVRTLQERLAIHRCNNDCRSRVIIDNGNYNIILIENYTCNSKKELESREGYYIRNNECINKNIPGRTDKEYQKEYYQKNKKTFNKNNKEYYQDNKDKISKQVKEYYQDNKDVIKEYQKYIREYRKSWGGDQRYNNNLLNIDVKLFL